MYLMLARLPIGPAVTVSTLLQEDVTTVIEHIATMTSSVVIPNYLSI